MKHVVETSQTSAASCGFILVLFPRYCSCLFAAVVATILPIFAVRNQDVFTTKFVCFVQKVWSALTVVQGCPAGKWFALCLMEAG